jgi:hypothetical protein
VYNGTDRHTNHWHLSVNDKHETDTSPWAIAERDDDMSAVDATNGFMAVLAQAANAALPAGDPNRAKDENGKELPTTQVGRNAVIFFRRILTPIMAADNDALIGAVLAKLPLGSMSSAQVEDALRSVLRDGVDG